MKNSEISILDDKEEELISLLQNLGMNTSTAKIIVSIAVNGESSSRDIEIVTGIKPSTISTLLKKLRESKIVVGVRKPSGVNGRGVTYYSLAGSMDEVLTLFVEKKMKETSKYIEQIKRLKGQIKK